MDYLVIAGLVRDLNEETEVTFSFYRDVDDLSLRYIDSVVDGVISGLHEETDRYHYFSADDVASLSFLSEEDDEPVVVPPPEPEPEPTPVPEPTPEPSIDGWEVIRTSPDSIVIYVSSSLGVDTNDGLAENRPVETISRALELTRSGFPDHILLKRGDTWTASLHLGGRSGRSEDEPFVVSAWGPLHMSRPLFLTGTRTGMTLGWDQALEYLVVTDIDFEADVRNPDRPSYDPTVAFFNDAIGLDGSSQEVYRHVLVEGCRFSHYAQSVVIQHVGGSNHDFITFRRNVIKDTYNLEGFCQAFYAVDVDNLLVEENFVDRTSNVFDDVGSIFDHAFYFNTGRVGSNTIFRENIVSRSDGIQMRQGGTCDNNLFVKTWIAISAGLANTPTQAGVPFTCFQNVILDGADINPNEGRGWAFRLGNIDGGVENRIFDNLVANNDSGFPVVFSVEPGFGGIRNLSIDHNTIYNWKGESYIQLGDGEATNFEMAENHFYELDGNTPILNIQDDNQVTGVNFFNDGLTHPDPTRSVERYDGEVAGGTGTYNSFATNLGEQRKGSWNSLYSAVEINRWIQQGWHLQRA